MKRITASVTERGQVTIPVEVRRALGVPKRGKVVFEVDEGKVRVLPALTLEETAGSVKPLQRPEDFDEIARKARDELADRYAQKFPRA